VPLSLDGVGQPNQLRAGDALAGQIQAPAHAAGGQLLSRSVMCLVGVCVSVPGSPVLAGVSGEAGARQRDLRGGRWLVGPARWPWGSVTGLAYTERAHDRLLLADEPLGRQPLQHGKLLAVQPRRGQQAGTSTIGSGWVIWAVSLLMGLYATKRGGVPSQSCGSVSVSCDAAAR
jgi:hypothetical protein